MRSNANAARDERAGLRSGTGVVEGDRATGSPWSGANRALVTARKFSFSNLVKTRIPIPASPQGGLADNQGFRSHIAAHLTCAFVGCF